MIDQPETRCRNCKYWGDGKSDPGHDPEYGEVPGTAKCKRVVEFWLATEWVKDSDSRALKPQFADRLAFAKDASDCYASLWTLPDFGCVQFAGRE
jgi:hypothetical protein